MHRILVTLCTTTLLTATALAQPKAKPLDDAALDSITAGGFTVTTGNGSFLVNLLNPATVGFKGQVETPKGSVVAVGTITAQNQAGNGSINVSGSALTGAQSLITILAANSTVNVLTNLVVLFNPTNVTITQNNTNH
jgi:hypothetical protein